MKKLLLISSLLASQFILPQGIAQTTDSNTNACATNLLRQTVVYVDDKNMVKNDTVWALTLAFKLTATMIPGESLSIVELSTGNGSSKELWRGCWPKPQKALSPIDVLKLQVEFSQKMNDVLLDILNKNGRDLKDVMIDAKNPPHKDIIKALVSDIKRFQQSSESTVRAIIYSDMAENSDLGSAFSAVTNETFTNKLNVYFVHGVFYAFGVGKNIYNGPNYLATSLHFWNYALKEMSGIPELMTREFEIPANIPEKGYYFSVSLHYNNEILPGKIAIMVGKDGKLIDSWIGITHLTGVGIEGNLTCSNDTCMLKAKTNGGLVGYDEHEDIELSISQDIATGSLTVNHADKFLIDGKK